MSAMKPASLIIVAGSSYAKVQKEKRIKSKVDTDDLEVKQNNKRGSVISGFSRQARSNMFYTMMRIRRDCFPCFVTLTYPKVYSEDSKIWKRDLHCFALRLRSRFPDVSAIWKLEPQRRGAPHYHILIWGAEYEELRSFVPYAWHEVIGSNDFDHLLWHLGGCGNGNIHCVQEVTTNKSMYNYVMKYVGKAATEKWGNVGKWWGILFKKNLPFGEEVVFEITEKNANDIMRYMRRFTGRTSINKQSRQICCDANQWMEKLQTVPTGTYLDWLKMVEGHKE